MLSCLSLAAPASRIDAQANCLPFGPGERLAYDVRAGRLGVRGDARFTVAGPELIRGRATYLLGSETSAGLGFLRGSERTASWIDPVRFAVLRFTQRERHLLARGSDSVEIFPEERAWRRADGATGAVASDEPLDELSFIYFLRTLPYGPDSSWTFNRHFDATRNPTVVRVLGRDSLITPAGRFAAWIVEMRVRDPARYGGDGVIQLHVSTDDRRLPLRIQSTIPKIGTTVMTLTASFAAMGEPCPRTINGAGR